MSPLSDLPQFKKMLDGYLSDKSKQRSPAVDLYTNSLRRKEREHIEAIFARLPESPYKREVQDRLLLRDLGSYLGAWYELMVYDWLDRLDKNPTPEPAIPNSSGRPDFLIESSGLRIFIEVFVAQVSAEDENVAGKARTVWPAATATFRRMGGRLEKKMGKYSQITQMPHTAYVICVCLESRLIELREVITFFLGNEVYNLQTCRLEPALDGQIFERHAGEPPSAADYYRHVSALLVAKRFRDSIGSDYRIEFGLIQNPYAFTPIPETEFGYLRRYVVVSETETLFTMKWV